MPGGFTESPSSTARHIRCSTVPGSERSMRPTLSKRGLTVGSKSRPHPCRKSYGCCRFSNRPSRGVLRSKSRGVHRDPLRFDARHNGQTHGIYARKGVGNSPGIPALPAQEEAATENPEKNLTTSIHYDHARRRRSARLSQSRGFHAGDQLFVSRRSHLLVLLRVVCAGGMNDLCLRPHPAKLSAGSIPVLVAAQHQTLLHGISRAVVSGKPRGQRREGLHGGISLRPAASAYCCSTGMGGYSG